MKTYRINTGTSVKEFATLPAACRYQDRNGGVLEFRGNDGVWYTPKN